MTIAQRKLFARYAQIDRERQLRSEAEQRFLSAQEKPRHYGLLFNAGMAVLAIILLHHITG